MASPSVLTMKSYVMYVSRRNRFLRHNCANKSHVALETRQHQGTRFLASMFHFTCVCSVCNLHALSPSVVLRVTTISHWSPSGGRWLSSTHTSTEPPSVMVYSISAIWTVATEVQEQSRNIKALKCTAHVRYRQLMVWAMSMHLRASRLVPRRESDTG